MVLDTTLDWRINVQVDIYNIVWNLNRLYNNHFDMWYKQLGHLLNRFQWNTDLAVDQF